MGLREDDIRRHLSIASGRVDALRQRISRAASEDYPSDTPVFVADHVLLPLCDALYRRLDRHASTLRKEANPEKLEDLHHDVNMVTHAAGMLAELIRYVEGARIGQAHWGLVEEVEAFCKNLFEAEDAQSIRVIVRPRWKYNYRFTELRTVIGTVVGGFIEDEDVRPIWDKTPYIVVLSFPSMELDNILEFGNWGHEIGHFLNLMLADTDEASISAKLAKATSFDDSKLGDLVEAVLSSEGIRKEVTSAEHWDEQRKSRLPQIRERLVRRLAGELEHLVADLFGMRLFGPASLLAIAEVARTQDLDSRGSTEDPYPPMRYRLAVMIKELAELGYLKWLEENKAQPAAASVLKEIVLLRDIANSVPTTHRAQIAPADAVQALEYELLEKAINEATDRAREVLRDLKSESFCTVEKLNESVFGFVRLLEDRIPPNHDRRTEIDPRRSCLSCILNAGWFYWLGSSESSAVGKRKWQRVSDHVSEGSRGLPIRLGGAAGNREARPCPYPGSFERVGTAGGTPR